MKVTAVGCIAGLLKSKSTSDKRYIGIYNTAGHIVGKYPINKTILDETGVFVRHMIPTLTLQPGTYYFATELAPHDFYNSKTVTDAYTVFDCYLDTNRVLLS